MKKILKLLLPPIFVLIWQKLTNANAQPQAPRIAEGLEVVASLELAQKLSKGYDDEVILAKYLASTQAVLSGKALFERDTVLFQEPELSLHILACLEHIQNFYKQPLHVLDFGGALGSFFIQHRTYFEQKQWPLLWTVVEQPHFVEAGKKYLSELPIFFEESILSAKNRQPMANVLFLSGVLPYLPEPLKWLEETLKNFDFQFVIIDRTLFSANNQPYFCVQHVPEHIYPSSYPCSVLSKSALYAVLSSHYRLLTSIKSTVDYPEQLSNGIMANYEGGFWVKK
ncbi:MAG: methyltransferase, TIGR04325 family [Cytophagales bacterium]|nr:MAG: methyltransferase, TIGR04325 family [Cytophagales bacterium]TAF60671.1 MAG: methyltransferase, TIGR04325 family [Cytophagales bacterium]